MSVNERDDVITARLVTSLDVLPVPAGPGALRPRMRPAIRANPLLVLVALLLILAATVTAPPVRDAVADIGRWLERLLVNPAWVGYYIVSDLDAARLPTGRVMFTAGFFPGMPTGVVASRSADLGRAWSHDGERLILYSGPKIYVGDRRGSVRELSDVGNLTIRRVDWVDDEQRIAAVANSSDGAWAVKVDLRGREIDRRPLPAALIVGSYTAFSPDGRWLSLDRRSQQLPEVAMRSGGCARSVLLDLTGDRVHDLASEDGRPLLAIGWLRDGRLVSALCDQDAARIAYYVGLPGTAAAPPIATLAWHPAWGSPGIIDRPRDRIVAWNEGGAQRTIRAVHPDGRDIELVRIATPASGDAVITQVNLQTVSGDGLYVSFTRVEALPGSDQFTSRASVVELSTGRVMHACDVGCLRVILR